MRRKQYETILESEYRFERAFNGIFERGRVKAFVKADTIIELEEHQM